MKNIKDNLFIIIGLLSILGFMLEFFDVISDKYNSLFIMGTSLFFIETMIKQKKKD